MMRILSLGVNLFPTSGGTYRAVSDFQEAFQASGIEHSVLNFSNFRKLNPSDEAPVIRTSRAWIARDYFWWNGCSTGQMGNLLERSDLLFVHGLFVQPLLRATLWGRARDVPYVVVPHGSLDPFVFTYRRFRKRAWMRLHGKGMLQYAARVLFSTLRERDKAVDCEKTRSAVLSWPVSWQAAYDKERAAHHLREELGLPTDRRLALFCGRLHPIKRPLETIQAFLNCASSDWTLIVVGDSSAELSIEQVRKAAGGAGNRVLVVGPVYGETLKDYYRAAELVLLLSKRENFGYVLAEALSHGTPVVVTDEMDLSPHILEERCGFVLRRSCAGGPWHELPSIFRSESGSLKEQGFRGRDWVRREFSKDRFRHGLIGLTKAIISPTQPDRVLP